MNLQESLLQHRDLIVANKIEFNKKDGQYLDQTSNENLLISIVIPVFNEEKSILSVLKRIPQNLNYEIILVDDGSTDNSLKNVKQIINNKTRIIKHKENRGYGAAILTGLKYANGDIIVTLDSDGQHDPKEIPKLLKPFINDKADITIGSRYLGKCNYKIPIYTRLGEYCINLILQWLYQQKIGNNQSGFRALKKSVLSYSHNFKNKGMAFSTEFLFQALENKRRIIEVPISMDPRKYGDSHVNLFKILKSIFSILIHYGLKKLICFWNLKT